MSPRQRTVVLLCVAATLVSCKKDPQPQPPIPGSGPAVAPTVAPTASPGTQAAPRARVDRVVSKETRWALGQEDAGPKPAPKPAAKPAGSTKTLAVATDADIAKYEADKAQAETEKAVNATLGAALPQLKPCFDKFGAPSGPVSISVRVHRSGYVNSSSATGVSADVQTCLDGVLRKLKVNGVQTDSITVTRTFKFKSGG